MVPDPKYPYRLVGTFIWPFPGFQWFCQNWGTWFNSSCVFRITPLKKRLQRKDIEILDDALNLIKDLNSVGRGASAILDNEEETRTQDMIKFQKKLESFRARLREGSQPTAKKDK